MFKTAIVFILGAAIGGLAMWKAPALAGAPAQPAKADNSKVDSSALNADVARLKNITPTLSHVMADVAFQYSNLWFAGQRKNWPLAMFYFNETRGRIKWMLRINPTPKTPDGDIVNAQGIYDAIDSSTMEDLKKAIANKDSAAFVSAYKMMLEACYTCHKSAGRPYLRPMVPTVAPQTIINYDPEAKWPS
jgi:cytochrome c553